jgi:large subunit ribosomal protein L18
MKTKKEQRMKRKLRIRAKVSGTVERPRMAVFRSHKALYVQLIDDTSATTVFSKVIQGATVANAKTLGAQVAAEAKKKGITTVVFDRGGFQYHGVVKALADAAREGGLTI